MQGRILTPEEIDQLAALDAARTQGEWTATSDGERIAYSFGGLKLFALHPEQAKHNADWIIACSTAIPDLLTTVQAMRELLDDADEYTDHSPGCSGWVIQDGKPVYGCKCGFNDWREKLKKLLGEGT